MKGGITVTDSRSALLVLRALLQTLPDSSGDVGSKLVLKFTLLLKLGLLERLHHALRSLEFLIATGDERRVLLRQFLLDVPCEPWFIVAIQGESVGLRTHIVTLTDVVCHGVRVLV